MESIIKDSPTKMCRKFDKSFKCEVVRNWLSSGKSAAVIAKEFGLELSPPPSSKTSSMSASFWNSRKVAGMKTAETAETGSGNNFRIWMQGRIQCGPVGSGSPKRRCYWG